MLRITKTLESRSLVTLKVEGRIVSEWVPVLKEECLRALRERQQVRLDLSDVSFIDRRGAEMLKQIESENLQIINCPALIQDLLTAEGDR